MLARKSSPVDQLKDAVNRLLERSNPTVTFSRKSIKKNVVCLECGSTKHSVRSHQKSLMRPKTRYDSEVDDLFIL